MAGLHICTTDHVCFVRSRSLISQMRSRSISSVSFFLGGETLADPDHGQWYCRRDHIDQNDHFPEQFIRLCHFHIISTDGQYDTTAPRHGCQ